MMNESNRTGIDSTAREFHSLISTTLAEMKQRGIIPCAPSDRAEYSPGSVKSLPCWVMRFGLVIEGANAWLWCEPEPSASGAPPGQAVIDAPRGRYLIDAIEAPCGACISRESAAGDPLVVGLPFTGSPVLLWIRPAP